MSRGDPRPVRVGALEHARLYAAQVDVVRRLRRWTGPRTSSLSSVSHELRTPLTSFNGYVELPEDEDLAPLSDPQRRMLDVVRRNVDRLRLLIEDLLTLSRIESGAFRSTLLERDLSAPVFDRFFRAGNAVSAGVAGTGLGLVIVRTILDNHGGSLQLSSAPGRGATVRMRLPWPVGVGSGRAETSGIAPRGGAL